MLLPRGNLILFHGLQYRQSVPRQKWAAGTHPACLSVSCSTVLCCAALGHAPSTGNREKGFLPRCNSSEQVWEEKNHCRHLKLGRVNPMLSVVLQWSQCKCQEWGAVGSARGVWPSVDPCLLLLPLPLPLLLWGKEMPQWCAVCPVQELGETKNNSSWDTFSFNAGDLLVLFKNILLIPGKPPLRQVCGEKIR